MNKWKVAFFLLLFTIISIIVGFFIWATSPSEELSVPKESIQTTDDSVLQVELTAKDFEKVINKLLNKEKDVFELNVSSNQLELSSELQMFGITVPIALYFEPQVTEDGNIQLKQTAANIGKLNLPSETVLKIMNDSIEMPNWVMIRPELNTIDVDLSKAKIMDGVIVKAKEINLEQDRVVLEIILSDN